MGNSQPKSFLDTPKRGKRVSRRVNKYYTVAAAEMQGWRAHMEDAIDIDLQPRRGKDVEPLPNDPRLLAREEVARQYSFVGVYDGHAGNKCSRFLASALWSQYIRQMLTDPIQPQAITQAVLMADRRFLNLYHGQHGGSTAVFSLVKPLYPARRASKSDKPVTFPEAENRKSNKSSSASHVASDAGEGYFPGTAESKPPKVGDPSGDDTEDEDGADQTEEVGPKRPMAYEVTTGTVGDSAALLIRKDGSFVTLTHDHKPNNPGEKRRIVRAGGKVWLNRVDGSLAMSRAMGDFWYKQDPTLSASEQKVIANPDVAVCVAEPGDLLLLMCDGLLERLSRAQLAAFVHHLVNKPSTAARQQSEVPMPTQNGQTAASAAQTTEGEDSVDLLAVVCAMLDWSLVKGSRDNMSAVLLRFGDGLEPTHAHHERAASTARGSATTLSVSKPTTTASAASPMSPQSPPGQSMDEPEAALPVPVPVPPANRGRENSHDSAPFSPNSPRAANKMNARARIKSIGDLQDPKYAQVVLHEARLHAQAASRRNPHPPTSSPPKTKTTVNTTAALGGPSQPPPSSPSGSGAMFSGWGKPRSLSMFVPGSSEAREARLLSKGIRAIPGRVLREAEQAAEAVCEARKEGVLGRRGDHFEGSDALEATLDAQILDASLRLSSTTTTTVEVGDGTKEETVEVMEAMTVSAFVQQPEQAGESGGGGGESEDSIAADDDDDDDDDDESTNSGSGSGDVEQKQQKQDIGSSSSSTRKEADDDESKEDRKPEEIDGQEQVHEQEQEQEPVILQQNGRIDPKDEGLEDDMDGVVDEDDDDDDDIGQGGDDCGCDLEDKGAADERAGGQGDGNSEGAADAGSEDDGAIVQ